MDSSVLPFCPVTDTVRPFHTGPKNVYSLFFSVKKRFLCFREIFDLPHNATRSDLKDKNRAILRVFLLFLDLSLVSKMVEKVKAVNEYGLWCLKKKTKKHLSCC